MTEDQITHALIVIEIQKQSTEVQDRINQVAQAIRNAVRVAGPEGYMAFALVGAELAAKGSV